MAHGARPAGMRLIIGYKLVKAPAMLVLAAVLTFAAAGAVAFAHRAVLELSESSWLGWRIAQWLEPHLTLRVEHRAAVLAWLDGASTLAEGLLLLSGRAWGEWLVIAGLATLLPLEVLALWHHPRVTRALILSINAGVVAYLVRRRLVATRNKFEHKQSGAQN